MKATKKLLAISQTRFCYHQSSFIYDRVARSPPHITYSLDSHGFSTTLKFATTPLLATALLNIALLATHCSELAKLAQLASGCAAPGHQKMLSCQERGSGVAYRIPKKFTHQVFHHVIENEARQVPRYSQVLQLPPCSGANSQLQTLPLAWIYWY